MRNAIILHGLPGEKEYYNDKHPSASNSHWLPWLQNQLLVNNIKADTPEVPNAYKPDYAEYVREIERFDITPETTLVGHSMGGGFWVKYLSQHPEIIVDKIVLVAPWINSDQRRDLDFFNFDIDSTISARTNKFTIFASDNDHESIKHSIKILSENIPNIDVRDFQNYGHFTMSTMKTDAFPELLTAIL